MKAFIEKWYVYIVGILVVGVASFSYAIGSIHGSQIVQNQVSLACDPNVLQTLKISSAVPAAEAKANVPQTNSSQQKGMYMGSKNGTKYYSASCPSAKRIKSENVIWFQSAQDAELQGYSPSSC